MNRSALNKFVFFVFFQKRVDMRWRARPRTALYGLLSGTRGLVACALLHVPSPELTMTLRATPDATAVALPGYSVTVRNPDDALVRRRKARNPRALLLRTRQPI